MTFKKLLMIVGVVAAVAVIALVLFNRMRGGHGGGLLSSRSGPRLKWKFNTDGNTAVGSIALGRDGTIYAGANNGIYAISPDNTRLWKQPIGGSAYLSDAEDGTVYVASARGLVFGYLPNGTLSWNPGQGLIAFGSPPSIGRNGYVLFANTVSDLFAFRPGSSPQPDWAQKTMRPGITSTDSSLPGDALRGGP